MHSTNRTIMDDQSVNTEYTSSEYAKRPNHTNASLSVPTYMDLLSAFFVEARLSTEAKNNPPRE